MDKKRLVDGTTALAEKRPRVIKIEPAERPQNVRLRVAAYTRVSSDSEDQLNSFAAQNRYYTELISGKAEWRMVDIYADEGITGTSVAKRDDFQRMMADCRRGLIDQILVKSMLHDFELELDGLNTSITQDQQELDRISSESVNAEKFIALVKRYTDFSELTPAMINEFVEKILVHQAEGKGASRTQEVEIFFNFVGKVEIPHEEIVLTEEEKAALAEQERRRAKKAEYNRRYMEKKRRQWRAQREREQEQKPHKLPPVADEKGEKSA